MRIRSNATRMFTRTHTKFYFSVSLQTLIVVLTLKRLESTPGFYNKRILNIDLVHAKNSHTKQPQETSRLRFDIQRLEGLNFMKIQLKVPALKASAQCPADLRISIYDVFKP